MEPSHLIKKIAPGTLRTFVEGEGETHASIIVEAAGGPLIQELPRVNYAGKVSGKVRHADGASADRVMDELAERLRALTGRDPGRLKLAEAFVVEDVTPRQLREIASWPETGTVRPNRVHRAHA